MGSCHLGERERRLPKGGGAQAEFGKFPDQPDELQRKSIPGRRNSMCKDPTLGVEITPDWV